MATSYKQKYEQLRINYRVVCQALEDRKQMCEGCEKIEERDKENIFCKCEPVDCKSCYDNQDLIEDAETKCGVFFDEHLHKELKDG